MKLKGSLQGKQALKKSGTSVSHLALDSLDRTLVELIFQQRIRMIDDSIIHTIIQYNIV